MLPHLLREVLRVSQRASRRLLSGGTVIVLALMTACGGGGEQEPASHALVTGAHAQAPRSDLLRSRLQAQPQQAAAPAMTTAHLFRWAQMTYPEHFPDSPPINAREHDGTRFDVRSYFNGNHLAVAHGHVYGLGAFTGNVVRDFGPVADYAAQVCATVDCGQFATEAVHDAVRVHPSGLWPIRDAVMQGGTVLSRTMSNLLTGDVAALANQTIYVVVEDPDGLFEPVSTLTVVKKPIAWESNLDLIGRPLTRAGRFSGELRVFACLDPQCQTRLKGTPLSLSYDVHVVPPMALSRNKVEVTVPYGTKPADIFIDVVTSPMVTEAYNWWTEVPGSPYSPDYLSNQVRGHALPGPNGLGTRIRLEFLPVAVGTYVGRFSVSANYIVFGGGLLSDKQFIDVVYNVTRDGLPAMMFFGEPDLISHFQGRDWYYDLVIFFASNRTGMTVEFVGFEYLQFPPAETDASLRTQWLATPPNALTSHEFHYSLRPCSPPAANGEKRCLAAGEYKAQARFRVRYLHPTNGSSVVEEFTRLITLVLE